MIIACTAHGQKMETGTLQILQSHYHYDREAGRTSIDLAVCLNFNTNLYELDLDSIALSKPFDQPFTLDLISPSVPNASTSQYTAEFEAGKPSPTETFGLFFLYPYPTVPAVFEIRVSLPGKVEHWQESPLPNLQFYVDGYSPDHEKELGKPCHFKDELPSRPGAASNRDFYGFPTYFHHYSQNHFLEWRFRPDPDNFTSGDVLIIEVRHDPAGRHESFVQKLRWSIRNDALFFLSEEGQEEAVTLAYSEGKGEVINDQSTSDDCQNLWFKYHDRTWVSMPLHPCY